MSSLLFLCRLHQQILVNVFLSHCVSRSVNTFFKNNSKNFSEILLKVRGLKCKKLTKPNFLKNYHLRQTNISPKSDFFLLLPRFYSIDLSFFTLKIVHDSGLFDLAKAACLEKLWFLSCGSKCSQPIRLHCSLIINISGRNQPIS